MSGYNGYSEIEVYKIAYDLTIHTYHFTEKIQRSFKYTLGEKLDNNVLELLINIYEANSNKDERYVLLQEGRSRIERLRLLFRLAKDLQILPVKRFVVFNEMVESISKQLTGWQRSVAYQKDNYKPQGQLVQSRISAKGGNGDNRLF